MDLLPGMSSSNIARDAAELAAAAEAQKAKNEGGVENKRENQPEVWAPYVCKTIKFGAPHPGHLVEASILAAVSLPPPTYPLEESLGQQIRLKSLSQMQLEGILYANQRFQRMLGNDTRAGFYLGDSAGVGKGRQISGIILDNLVRGRPKHCWFSVSSDLHIDATRDIRDIGCNVNVVSSIAKLSEMKSEARLRPGVLFSTYAGLISKGKESTGKTRMEELIEWLKDGKPEKEYDGVIVFDEAHKAKNFRDGESDSTQVGNAVHQMQTIFPNARVVYASATCVSHVEDMQYMTRLGYWGKGAPYESFVQFKSAMVKAGVSGMELLAIDMKTTGRAVVRNVSYQGAEFSIAVASLTSEKAKVYRAATELWNDIFVAMNVAKKLCTNKLGDEEDEEEGMDDDERAMQQDEGDSKKLSPAEGKTGNSDYAGLLAQYWASHQRFFAQLILSMKVDLAVDEVKKALAKGMCAVIGLQSTGDAALQRALEYEGLMDEKETNNIVSVCKSVARLFLKTQFPVRRNFPLKSGYFAGYQPNAMELLVTLTAVLREKLPIQQVEGDGTNGQANETVSKVSQKIFNYLYDPLSQERITWPMYRDDNTVVEAERMRAKLLDRLERMQLPACALDDLIDKLGGPDCVAEMTGRSVRQVRTKTGKYVVESRAPPLNGNPTKDVFAQKHWWADSANIQTDSLNVLERGTFLRGQKLIAVISAAASTGISLHADRNVPNQRRRLHCTLELPWAADQAIQQLGRSHRTNQSSAPVFCLISSGLGGENRFVSSVARRLQSLGAITQGDRRASLGAMSLGGLQLESTYGIQALKQLFRDCGVTKETKDLNTSEGTQWTAIVQQSNDFIQLDLACQGANSKFCPALPCKDEATFLKIIQSGLQALQMDPHAKQRERKTKDTGKNIVTKFLNRILGLPFTHQTLLFNYFCSILEVTINKDDVGILTLSGKLRRAAPKTTLFTDQLGRPVYEDKLLVDTGMDFDLAIREVRFLLALYDNQKIDRDSIPLERNLSDEIIELLLEECQGKDIGFHINRNYPTASRQFYVLLVREPLEAGKEEWPCYRPYNGTGTLHIKKSELDRVYEPITDVKKIRKAWKQSYEATKDMSPPYCGTYEYSILSGNLIPILGDVCSVDAKGDSKLNAYIAITEDTKERIVGILPTDTKGIKRAIHDREVKESMFKVHFPSVVVQPGEPMNDWRFGFEIDKKGKVIDVSERGKELSIKVGHKLEAINGVYLSPTSAVTDLHSALRYHIMNMLVFQSKEAREAPPETIQVSFQFSRLHREVHDEMVEAAAPISYATLQHILINPKKERKSMEKLEKVLHEFDTDSEDENILPRVATTGKKTGSLKRSSSSVSTSKKKMKASESSVTPRVSSSARNEEEDEEEVEKPIAKKLTFQATRVIPSGSNAPPMDSDAAVATPVSTDPLSRKSIAKSSTSSISATGRNGMSSASSATTTTAPKRSKPADDDDDDDLLSYNFRRSTV